jgi:hypothetical protein
MIAHDVGRLKMLDTKLQMKPWCLHYRFNPSNPNTLLIDRRQYRDRFLFTLESSSFDYSIASISLFGALSTIVGVFLVFCDQLPVGVASDRLN